MYRILLVCSLLLFACNQEVQKEVPTQSGPVIVIHGGAGNISREYIDKDREKIYIKALEQALDRGYAMLESGADAIEVVQETIKVLEDDSLFNAGKGSVLNAMGMVENDASIMDGSNLKAGAVASVSLVKNPIALARLVMDSTAHVMLSGQGASVFADRMHMERVDTSYYMIQKRRKQREEILKQNEKYGTVGCVVLDTKGNIAAGTSTGGMHKKKWGRIGDSPIIGAGTYADNAYAGVSCTGHGEFFIRNAVAYDLVARMKYGQQKADVAARDILHDVLDKQNAKGGLIAIDKWGNVIMDFNTKGMFRGYKKSDGKTAVFLFDKLSENR